MGLEKRWMIRELIDANTSRELEPYTPILKQLLYNRGIRTRTDADRYLNLSGSLNDPFLLSGMEKAVKRIHQAISGNEVIIIYGDYDVDGVTASTLMVEVFRTIGGNAIPYIPNRFDEGYGFSLDGLENLITAHGKPGLIITVDCGVRSPHEVEAARIRGIDTIISDHHEPGQFLPDAVAVICPKKPGDEYPEKNLSGVGVAYKICEAYLIRYPNSQVEITTWLDLVALGTVADIVPLTGENRSLVKAGIRQMRLAKRPGLVSLANAAGININSITTQEISFGIAPRLNAAGRLETAMLASDLLLSQSIEQAAPNAQRLDDQNRQRQAITRETVEVASKNLDPKAEDYILIASNPAFNIGVIGLVASKLVDTYHRPAIVGADLDGYLRASCRSIPEFHITRALDQCSDLFEKHGGHAMAAGFTIASDRFPDLKIRLEEIARNELSGMELKPVLEADMEIDIANTHPKEVFTSTELIEPIGAENADVRFVARELQVIESRRLSDGRHLKMKLKSGYYVFDAIAFGHGDKHSELSRLVDIIFNYELNTYRGDTNIQLNVRDIKNTLEGN